MILQNMEIWKLDLTVIFLFEPDKIRNPRVSLVGWSSPEGPVMIGGYKGKSDLTTEIVY